MMKIFQLLFVFLVHVVFLSSTIYAQKPSTKFQLGLGANGILSINNWSPLQAGAGSEFQLWLTKPLGSKNSLRFIAGFRRLTGFQLKSVHSQERYFPDEFQTIVQTKDIASLDYLDASINWFTRWNEHSAWSLGVGLRWSYLTSWSGHEQTIGTISYRKLRISETSFSASSGSFTFNQAIPFSTDYFDRNDLGILLHLKYEIVSGLSLNVSYAKGLNSIFREKYSPKFSNFRITTFSIGLSARLI